MERAEELKQKTQAADLAAAKERELERKIPELKEMQNRIQELEKQDAPKAED